MTTEPTVGRQSATGAVDPAGEAAEMFVGGSRMLDALRPEPTEDVAEVTRRPGPPRGQGPHRRGQSARRMEFLGRMRTDRVMRQPVPMPWISPSRGGRPPKHGREVRFAEPVTRGEPAAAPSRSPTAGAPLDGATARAMAWNLVRPRPTTRSAWIDHTGELPLIEGTLIRIKRSTACPAATKGQLRTRAASHRRPAA